MRISKADNEANIALKKEIDLMTNKCKEFSLRLNELTKELEGIEGVTVMIHDNNDKVNSYYPNRFTIGLSINMGVFNP